MGMRYSGRLTLSMKMSETRCAYVNTQPICITFAWGDVKAEQPEHSVVAVDSKMLLRKRALLSPH